MNDFFKQLYFDNTVKDYCISFGIILFILLLNRVISKYFAGLLFAFAKRISKGIDKKAFIDLLIHPLGMFLIVFVTIASLHKLNFPGLWDVEIYQYTLKVIVHALATMVLIISFIWLLLRIIDFIAIILEQKANRKPDLSDNQLIVFFKDFFKVEPGSIGHLPSDENRDLDPFGSEVCLDTVS